MNDTISFVNIYSKYFSKWNLSTGSIVAMVVINIILTILSQVVNTPMVYILLTKKKFRTMENFIASNLFLAGVIGSLVPPLVVIRLLCKSYQHKSTVQAVLQMILIAHSQYTVFSVLIIAVHRAINFRKLRAIRDDLTLKKRFFIVFIPAYFAIVNPFIAAVIMYHSVTVVGVVLFLLIGSAILIMVVSYASIVVQLSQSRNRNKQVRQDQLMLIKKHFETLAVF